MGLLRGGPSLHSPTLRKGAGPRRSSWCLQYLDLLARGRCARGTERADSQAAGRRKPIGCEVRREGGAWEVGSRGLGARAPRPKLVWPLSPEAAPGRLRRCWGLGQPDARTERSGAAPRPGGAGWVAAVAVAVAAAAGLGYLSNCVSGARRRAALSAGFPGGRGARAVTLGAGRGPGEDRVGLGATGPHGGGRRWRPTPAGSPGAARARGGPAPLGAGRWAGPREGERA
ncbi:PREDICTED: translation initiation factor IF-2-like, partial [Chinchilla lanigera]|uniref:translation initiation factor IF-2-like n=1 Tax=Chinchilla lanigera TaxID=34839 RepID=UPI000698FF88